MKTFQALIDPRVAGVAIALFMTLLETGLVLTAANG
jgi:hypothetical protein